MKKLLTLVFALALCASLSFAQAGGGSTGDKSTTTTTESGKKAHKGGKKSHKGGKKGKKGSDSSGTATTPK